MISEGLTREDIEAFVDVDRVKMESRRTKVKLIFAWYDIWVGVFIDKPRRIVYFFPVPMFGFKITLGESQKNRRTMK